MMRLVRTVLKEQQTYRMTMDSGNDTGQSTWQKWTGNGGSGGNGSANGGNGSTRGKSQSIDLESSTDAASMRQPLIRVSSDASIDSPRDEEPPRSARKEGTDEDGGLTMRRFFLLSARSCRQLIRDPSLIMAQLMLVCGMAFLIGIFARDLKRDFTGVQTRVFLFNFMVLFFALLGMSSIGALVQERHVFARERANRFYGTMIYAVAKALVCDVLPLRVIPPIIFGTVVYDMIGLSQHTNAFENFIMLLVLVNVASSAFCMLLSAACAGVSGANFNAAAFFLYAYMFSGLFMAGTHGAIANIKYTSIFFFAWEALVSNEFPPGSTFEFNPQDAGVSADVNVTNAAILKNFNLEEGKLIRDSIVVFFFIVGCLFVTFLVLYNSKFRR
jgi:hypothetical protein